MKHNGALVQIGGRRRFLVASALAELSVLRTCAFDFVLTNQEAHYLSKIFTSNTKISQLYKIRTLPVNVKPNLIRNPSSLLYSNISRKLTKKSIEPQLELGRSVQKALVDSDLENCNFVYAYDKASALVLTEAKSRAIKAILDQTIAPNDSMHDLLREEANRIGIKYQGISESSLSEIMEEQRQSWQAADVIVCGSKFVKDQLTNRGIQAPIFTVRPVLVNQEIHLKRRLRQWDGNRPLRLVTVGSAGLRKGAHLAIEAASKLSNTVDWRWIGSVDPVIQKMIYPTLPIKFEGILKGEKLFEMLSWADVFVLPSLWEGSAFAITEAAALGLPCIVTESSGSWVINMHTGIVIPNACPKLLLNAIEHILKSPDLVLDMSEATLAEQSSYRWNDYKMSLMNVINS